MSPKICILCIPDIDKPIGGVKQLYRHAEHLQALGFDTSIITQRPGFRPSWFNSTAHTQSFSEAFLSSETDSSNTILVVPETYVGVDFTNYLGQDLSRYAKVIFNQNAYYSYGGETIHSPAIVNQFYDDPSVLQVFSISEDTHRFLSLNLSLPDSILSRIVNSIEPSFSPATNKHNNLCWMPRKNSSHVDSVLLGINRASFPSTQIWQPKPVVNLSHIEVADLLNQSRIFLSFGHPEGFGLPVAEAMASGCWVIGYTGGGARELFRFGASHQVEYGDWSSFLLHLREVISLFDTSPRHASFLLQQQSAAVRSLYSFEAERLSIKTAWSRTISKFNSFLLQE